MAFARSSETRQICWRLRAYRAKLQRRFKAHLKRARVICLDMPDDHAVMQLELVELLEKKVQPRLR